MLWRRWTLILFRYLNIKQGLIMTLLFQSHKYYNKKSHLKFYMKKKKYKIKSCGIISSGNGKENSAKSCGGPLWPSFPLKIGKNQRKLQSPVVLFQSFFSWLLDWYAALALTQEVESNAITLVGHLVLPRNV